MILNSSKKGKIGELEVVSSLKTRGLKASRAGYQQASQGNHCPDVICADLPLHLEVKRDQRLQVDGALLKTTADAEATDESKTPVVVHRKNGEKFKATLWWQDFLNLIHPTR